MARSLTFQDVTWFLDLYEKGQLNLDPPYQRRSVWSPKDRRYFIDTILNDYPAPPVFLHKTLDDKGKATYHVVDGKQRLQTIINFTLGKVRIPDDFGNAVLQGKRWKDLERATKESFWNYTIIVELLPDASEAAIRSTFERINRNARKLSPQEMRHAKHDGWFATFAENEAEQPEWRELGISTPGRAKRMQDVQFVSELMLLTLKGQVIGFDQNILDDVYAEYDDLADLPDFSDDEFRKRFDGAKKYVMDCLGAEPSLREFLKTQLHLYSLWGVLLQLPEPKPEHDAFATRYLEFLGEVSAFIQSEQVSDVDMAEESKAAVQEYAASSRGATTELSQREGRHSALKTFMAGVGAADHENQ